MWVFEEFWHGDAIADVLAAHGELAGAARIAPMRRALRWRERFAPLVHGLGSALVGVSYTAVHMTWGAVNEWTTQAGYGRLAARAQHATLAELLKRIMRQEGRHIDFYASQAKARLEADRRAQRLTRQALARFWRPVGSDVLPEQETRFIVRHLFSGDEGRVGAEHEDVQLTRSDLAEDRVPPALAARELAIDSDLPLRPLDVAGEHVDGVLVLAGIAMKTVMATLVPSLLWSHAS
jgi:hypothetical protein